MTPYEASLTIHTSEIVLVLSAPWWYIALYA